MKAINRFQNAYLLDSRLRGNDEHKKAQQLLGFFSNLLIKPSAQLQSTPAQLRYQQNG